MHSYSISFICLSFVLKDTDLLSFKIPRFALMLDLGAPVGSADFGVVVTSTIDPCSLSLAVTCRRGDTHLG